MVRGRDPWADMIVAHPWSPASLLEYAYLFDAFVRYDNYFVVVSGRKAGVVSLYSRRAMTYIYSLGLLPEFQRHGLGRQLTEFITGYAHRHQSTAVVGSVARANRPVHAVLRALGGRPLGLSTTTMKLLGELELFKAANGIEVDRISGKETKAAWRRWRLYEVEQLADAHAAGIAAELLDSPPVGYRLRCRRDSDEVGIAVVRRRLDGWEAGLFPLREYWTAAGTARLLAAVSRFTGRSLRWLTVTQTHANALDASPSEGLRYERRRSEERHLVFIR